MRNQELAVIYRWTVAEEHQAEFRELWHAVTLELRELGGLGSCLSRNSSGDFVAFARWPSEKTRTAAFATRGATQWKGILHFEEEKLEVEDDLLLNR